MATPYSSETFLQRLLVKALAAGASDIYLKVGQPPGARVHGELVYFRADVIEAADTAAVVKRLLGEPSSGVADAPEQRAVVEVGTLGRFRVTAYRQRGYHTVLLRALAAPLPGSESLGLAQVLRPLVAVRRGLVVLAAGAGQGGSTTLAALLRDLAADSARHVLTVEEPIEHLIPEGKASICQREVGRDVASMAEGARSAVRLDADVLALASLDAPETLRAAVEAAEAGLLVFGVLRALDAPRAVVRLAAAEPALRPRLLGALSGVLGQRLLRRRDGSGMQLVAELLTVDAALRDTLRSADDLGELGARAQRALPADGSIDAQGRALVAEGSLREGELGP